MHCTAVYDNSRDNPFNPDPAATVRLLQESLPGGSPPSD